MKTKTKLINKKTLKTLMFSLGMAVLMLQAMPVNAQFVINKGLLKNPYLDEEQSNRKNRGMLGGGSRGEFNISTQGFGSDDYGGFNIGTQLFGEVAPLGSGCLVLAFAGAAYAFKKRKNNNKNNQYEENQSNHHCCCTCAWYGSVQET